jgi:hypothetical protein
VLDVAGHEERLAHVEHEERGHTVVREAFPGLREREIREADRFAEERAAGGARAIGRGEGEVGHGIAGGGTVIGGASWASARENHAQGSMGAQRV